MTPDRWTSFLSVRVVRDGLRREPTTLPPLLGTYRVDGRRPPVRAAVPARAGPPLPGRVRPGPAPRGGAVARSRPGDRWPAPPTSARLTAEFSPPERPSRPSTTVTAVYPVAIDAAREPAAVLHPLLRPDEPGRSLPAHPAARRGRQAGRRSVPGARRGALVAATASGSRCSSTPAGSSAGSSRARRSGPVLEAGKSYELVVDRGWPDADGNPLKAGFRKTFRAGPPDETSPDPKTWSVHPPAPETRDPLEVRFPEPLDRALLDRLIAVRDAADKAVRGTISVDGEETVWRFIPADPWRPGDYRLVIGTELEDAAGNSIARPFEVDAVGPITRRIASETVALPFRIGTDGR